MKAIATCLEAAGIKQVIWIDDYFASPTRDELEHGIQNHIQELKARGDLKVDFFLFKDLDLAKSKDALEEACTGILEALPEKDLADALKQLEKILGISSASENVQPDLSDDDFKSLQAAFGKSLRTFSLGEWTRSQNSVQNIGAETLFIIDKEFSRERAQIDGTDILSEIVKRTDSFCVMLTHTCSEGEQEEQRVAFATSKDIYPHRFAVLAKRQEGDADIDPRFARVIQTVMTHRFTGLIAFEMSEVIKSAATKTAFELARQSVNALEQAVFENAEEEGVPEYDVMIRVFGIEQRHAINEALKQPKLQDHIRASRQFRRATSNVNTRSKQADMTFFRGWRKREMFQDGESLNPLHSPLSSGDVFETDDGKKFVLIGQSCDLMVRNTGKRRSDVGLMAFINEDTPNASEPSGHRFFEVKGIFGDQKMWRVDYQSTVAVDLGILELAVFNADGVLRLQSNHSDPVIALTPGWAKRLKNAKTRFFKDNQARPQPVCIGRYAETLAPKIEMPNSPVVNDQREARHESVPPEKESVKNQSAPATAVLGLIYPLKRIGRFESSLSTAILAAAATFQTRAALDHDFAQSTPLEQPHPLENPS